LRIKKKKKKKTMAEIPESRSSSSSSGASPSASVQYVLLPRDLMGFARVEAGDAGQDANYQIRPVNEDDDDADNYQNRRHDEADDNYQTRDFHAAVDENPYNAL
jgi:hypothetical protein